MRKPRPLNLPWTAVSRVIIDSTGNQVGMMVNARMAYAVATIVSGATSITEEFEEACDRIAEVRETVAKVEKGL